MKYLKNTIGCDQEALDTWYKHWVILGFESVEKLLPNGKEYSFGYSPSLADVYLMPQIYNAHRFGVDFGPYPRIKEIETACSKLEEFEKAHPDNQSNKTT